MAEIKDIRKKTVFELKEQLQRQKEILKSIKFLEKLPDKGEKLKIAIKSLEDELSKRKEEPAPASSAEMLRVAKLEWSAGKNQLLSQPRELDSDDESDEEADEMTTSYISHPSLQNSEIVDPLRLVATSQISQKQPKIVSFPSEDPSNGAPLLQTETKTLSSQMKRMALNKPAVSTAIKTGITSPTSSNSRIPSKSPSKHESFKYDESLFPLKALENPPLKVLSLKESFQFEEEQQQKYEELLKSQSSKDKEPRKLYAYDELLKHGKIPMTTFEIIHADAEKDEYMKALRDVPLDDCVEVSEEEVEHISEEECDSDDDDE